MRVIHGAWTTLLALALLMPPGVAHAQRVTVDTSVSSAQVAVGDDLVVQMRADCEDCQIQNLELPALNDFEVMGRSVTRPMQVQITNGAQQVRVSVVHTFQLRARQPGRVRIPPAVAVVNGQRHAGNSVDLQILPAGQGGSVQKTPAVDLADAVGAGLPPDLPDGLYTATYHVVSADSHPVSGGITFTVGKPSPGQAGFTQGKTISELLAESEAGTVTEVGLFATAIDTADDPITSSSSWNQTTS